MAEHAPRFLELVRQAKTRIGEVSVGDLHALLGAGRRLYLLDVREEREWSAGSIPTARHLCKGILERDIEQAIPDTTAEIVLYCGGGFRSALAADNLRQMGYTGVLSMAGGIHAWRQAGLPLVPGAVPPAADCAPHATACGIHR